MFEIVLLSTGLAVAPCAPRTPCPVAVTYEIRLHVAPERSTLVERVCRQFGSSEVVCALRAIGTIDEDEPPTTGTTLVPGPPPPAARVLDGGVILGLPRVR